jgi:phosphotriesterase-related protein
MMMSRHGLSGKIQTVSGSIDPDLLGVTLSHEHLLWDASYMYKESDEKIFGNEPVKMENLDWLKRHEFTSIDNLKQLDEDVALDELRLFKKAGGCAVVDMGNTGLLRNPMGLANVSKATDVHIIMGSGYYVGASHPADLFRRSISELSEEMNRDIFVGVGETRIKAGILGEIGCSFPLQDNEIKVLKAVAETQSVTGAPVNIHPGGSQSSPMEIIELFHSFGGDVRHTAVSHICNRHGMDVDLTIELAETGCYIEYDSFGNSTNPIILPEKTFYALNDWQRITCIKEMIDHGYLDRLLISHDVFHKTDLRRYGGFGYNHIHATVIPLMRLNGVTENQIHSLLVDNPKRFLQFK